MYFTEHDAEITGALPAGTPRAEVFRVGGVRWWSLSPARRKVYEDKFIQSRSDYHAMLDMFSELEQARLQEEAEQKDGQKDDVRRCEHEGDRSMESADSVRRQAGKEGYTRQYKLLVNNEVFSSVPKQKLLDALIAAKGSVIAARKIISSGGA